MFKIPISPNKTQENDKLFVYTHVCTRMYDYALCVYYKLFILMSFDIL